MYVNQSQRAPFYIFRHYESVGKFENFLMSPKGLALNFFDLLQQTGFSKSPKAPALTISKALAF